MLPALTVAADDQFVMLLDIDTATLAQMANVLLQDRGTWSMKQWRNQCRYFSALTSELEQGALAEGRHWEASEVHDIAWRFGMQSMDCWPVPTQLATGSTP